MSRAAASYVCTHCGTSFISRNNNPHYCSRACHYDARRGTKRVHRPMQVCPTCGASFERRNWQGAIYCSVPCSRLGIRKHQREDRTTCLACNAPLTPRQISNRNIYCSRTCHGTRLIAWHAVPENKELMRTRGAKTVATIRKSRTSIERTLSAALDTAGIEYVEQFPISNHHGTIFICDFGFPDAMLIVEADGDYWHSLPNVIRKDHHKDKYLHACGYTVLRFTETQIKHDVDACVHVIRSHLP